MARSGILPLAPSISGDTSGLATAARDQTVVAVAAVATAFLNALEVYEGIDVGLSKAVATWTGFPPTLAHMAIAVYRRRLHVQSAGG